MSAEVRRPLGLVVKSDIAAAEELGREVIAWAKKIGLEVKTDDASAHILGVPGVPAYQLATQADPIVILGGDGTMIGIARYVTKLSPLLIGVNFGTLGFLTELTPHELMPALKSLIEKNTPIPTAQRRMLYGEVHRVQDGKETCIFSSQGVNDFVIQKSSKAPLVNLDLAVDGEDLVRIRADGLIMATPTGSTAYSLAAGGSIVHPEVSAFLVTPICAHSLTSRPLIVGMNSRIEVRVPLCRGKVLCSVDGQVSIELETGDRVRIKQADNLLKFACSPRKTYFEILRGKLNWGVANKSE